MGTLNKIPKTGTYGTAVDAMNDNFTLIQQALAEGYSPYQVWLDQGNTGTEQDFLDSLKGNPGINLGTDFEAFGALSDLEGKTAEQKEAMVPDGKAVEEMGTVTDGKVAPLKDEIYGTAMLSAANFASLNKTARRYLKASDGASNGSAYGSSGVYYATVDYIDVSKAARLAYRLKNANAADMALLAAYDENKQYLPDYSITQAGSATREGIWERHESVKYVRFTIYYNNGGFDFFAYDPDLLKRRVDALAATVQPLDAAVDALAATVQRHDNVIYGKDYFANSLTDHSPTYRKYIVAGTGASYSGLYGSGNRYRISGYIDASTISKLCYNIAFYCKQSVAVIAAYDSNHKYIQENSVEIQLSSSAKRVTGTWVKGETTAYIRLGMDTNYGSQYVTVPDSVSAIDKRVTALEAGVDVPAIVQRNPDAASLLAQMRQRGDTANTKNNTSTTVLLHLSDIHGKDANMAGVVSFRDYYGAFIDDVVNTGDVMANSYGSQSSSTVQRVDGADNILTAIGNHDTANYSGGSYDWRAHVGADAYGKFIKPYAFTTEVDEDTQEETVVNVWGVTWPDDAEENGYCFYYKDYPSGVRLIVLDAMSEATYQLTWLTEVLTGAKESNKTVVIAIHFVNGIINCFACGMSQTDGQTGSNNYYNATLVTQYVTLVQQYIDGTGVFEGISGGGKFACWLSGHSHVDAVGTLAAYPKQIVARVAMAAWDNTQSSVSRFSSGDSFDDFNIVCIDPTNNLLQLAKVGSRYNRALMERKRVSINFMTQTVVHGAVPITRHQDISGKEDRVAVVSISGTALSAEVGKYYVGASVETLAVTLPTVADASHLANVVLNIATGASPAVTFTAATGVVISYSKDFALEASKEYEVNCLWQGSKWIIMAVEVETPS